MAKRRSSVTYVFINHNSRGASEKMLKKMVVEKLLSMTHKDERVHANQNP